MIGTSVGSYRIASKLSVGGMGTVYRAEHALIGKLAAVKVLHPELSRSHDIVNRFFNEAKATTAIKHPGIVEVFDFGYLPNGDAYLVMEFLEGMSLARRCKTKGTMSEGEAAILLRSICSALAAAHAKGIVHRDLKPDNIFLTPDPDSALGDRPKLLDFGIAKLTDSSIGDMTTKTGAVMGTPTYMSPEQCRGKGQVDHRADLYSLGCIFYELVTGKPPFTNMGAGELIGAHLYVQPDSPRTRLPTISEQSERLIMALLSKDPAARPQTAKELAQRLELIAQQQGWITNTSPNGVTAQSLAPLTPPLGLPTDRGAVPEDDGDASATVASSPPHTSTPPPAHFPAETPTTLSGAASQSVVDMVPKRSHKGLALAMTASALIAGSTVAFFKLRGRDAERPSAAATSPAAPAPAPTPTAAASASPATAAPTPTTADPTPTPTPALTATPKPSPIEAVLNEDALPAETPPKDNPFDDGKPPATAAAKRAKVSTKTSKPTAKRTKPAQPAVETKPFPTASPAPTKPEPVKPKRPTLIETDL